MVVAAISGRASLPSLAEREQWLKDAEEKMSQERGINPASPATHYLGLGQLDYIKNLSRLAGSGMLTRSPNFSGEEAALFSLRSDGEVLHMLELKEAVYTDSFDFLPSFPGGSDDYRRRVYQVDAESGTFSVSIAARKANGEGPVATTTAATEYEGASMAGMAATADGANPGGSKRAFYTAKA